MTLYSLRKYNPKIDITLYLYDSNVNKEWEDDVKQDFQEYNGKDYLKEVEKLNIKIKDWKYQAIENATPSHKSNIFKWEMLSKNNCIYFDMDILFLKDISKLIDLITQNTTLLCFENYLMIGVLGSNGKNSFFNSVYKNCNKVFNKNRYQTLGVENIYKLLYGGYAFYDNGSVDWNYILKSTMVEDIEKLFNTNVVNIPKTWFYKYDNNNIHKIYYNSDVDLTDMIGIHWYGGHVVSQKYNLIFTEEYIEKSDLFICKTIRGIL